MGVYRVIVENEGGREEKRNPEKQKREGGTTDGYRDEEGKSGRARTNSVYSVSLDSGV